MAAPPASHPVSWFRYLWHLLQGALLLGVCLAAAGWVLWKQFGERWWYVQQQRSSQVIDDMSNEDLHRLLGGKHVPAWVNFPDFQRVQWVNDVIGEPLGAGNEKWSSFACILASCTSHVPKARCKFARSKRPKSRMHTLERQVLSCMHLTQHELESIFIKMIIIKTRVFA